jgi:sugar transferase (PEP-CTERM/EpsH1 system associated)
MKDIEAVKQYCSDLHLVLAYKRREFAVIQALLSFQPYRVVKFWHRSFYQKVCQLLQSKAFDVIWIHCLNMAAYLNPALTHEAIVVLDQLDIDEFVWERYARNGNWAIRMFARWNLIKLRRFRERVLRYFDVILSVSEQEAEFTRKRAPKSCRIWTVPNGVDVEYFRPPSEEGKKGNIIMFSGSMDVTMNIDAVVRFVREIFPVIKKAIPDVEFWIVGRNPDLRVRKLVEISGVRVTGTVEDVRPYYERAKVFVAPLRYGAGTKLKILEAMAMGVPIVSTSVGCQGINVAWGKHLFVEDDNERMAERVIELLENESVREGLSAAGRALVEKKYSWQSVISETESKLQELVAKKKARKRHET